MITELEKGFCEIRCLPTLDHHGKNRPVFILVNCQITGDSVYLVLQAHGFTVGDSGGSFSAPVVSSTLHQC